MDINMIPIRKVSSKYDWKIYNHIEWIPKFPTNVFAAIKEGEDNLYYCQIVENGKTKKYIEIDEKFRNFSLIIPNYDIITINNLTYIFYEYAQPINEINIDEKKLLKMFIELNIINASKDIDFIINYNSVLIVSKEDYKIYLIPSIEESIDLKPNDYYLINRIMKSLI